MALSNKQGGLVLTTGNKSEMATGYCTLYGDMVGALAVIGDLYKTEVYALSRYVNREREIIPHETIDKEPSAELRPGQKDTDSLPPYEVLDPILRAYVEDYRSADEIAKMRERRSGAGAEDHPAGGARGVQAAAGRTGVEGFEEGIWHGQALSHCGEA